MREALAPPLPLWIRPWPPYTYNTSITITSRETNGFPKLSLRMFMDTLLLWRRPCHGGDENIIDGLLHFHTHVVMTRIATNHVSIPARQALYSQNENDTSDQCWLDFEPALAQHQPDFGSIGYGLKSWDFRPTLAWPSTLWLSRNGCNWQSNCYVGCALWHRFMGKCEPRENVMTLSSGNRFSVDTQNMWNNGFREEILRVIWWIYIKATGQYLLPFQVSRYCLLALKGTMHPFQ